MSQGQGFARRITKDNFSQFKKWLRKASEALSPKTPQQKEGTQEPVDSPFKGQPLALPNRFTPPAKPKGAKIQGSGKKATQSAPTPTIAKPAAIAVGKLLWAKKLAPSDAELAGANTNPVGGIKLTKS